MFFKILFNIIPVQNIAQTAISNHIQKQKKKRSIWEKIKFLFRQAVLAWKLAGYALETHQSMESIKYKLVEKKKEFHTAQQIHTQRAKKGFSTVFKAIRSKIKGETS